MAGEEQQIVVTQEIHASSVSQIASLQLQNAEMLAARYLAQLEALQAYVQQQQDEASGEVVQLQGQVEAGHEMIRTLTNERDDLMVTLGQHENKIRTLGGTP